ncbi:MAG: 4Fe-4S dicluster domain-containing protein, partial [Bacillota bacterium]
ADLNIIDGVWGMEGEGPSAGETRNYGHILAAKSPFALDIAVANLLGVTPVSKAPIIKAALERGLPGKMEDINICGDELTQLKDVKIPQLLEYSNLLDRKLPPFLVNILMPLLRPRPVFNREKCIGCGDCYRSCPPQVIKIKDKKAEVDLSGCIRCFCCQELCQYKAVDIKRPLLGKLFKKW